MRPLRSSVLPLLVALAAPLVAQDGSIDVTFGGGDGLAVWGGGARSIELAGGAAHVDGRLFVVGAWDDPADADAPDAAWALFSAAGELDRGCAPDLGAVVADAVASRLATALVDESGRLVVAGRAALAGSPTTHRALVARIDPGPPGCALDGSFSLDGWELFDEREFCDAEPCEILDVGLVRPSTGAAVNPRLVLLLRAEVNAFVSRYFLVGLSAAGFLDPQFGDLGYVELDAPVLGPLSSAGRPRLDVDGLGRIWLLVGHHDPADPLDLDVIVARFTPEGALDPTFDGDGIRFLETVSDVDGVPQDLAVHADLAVTTVHATLGNDSIVTCFLAAGAPPTCGSGSAVALAGLAAQGDGKLLRARTWGQAASHTLAVDRLVRPFFGDPTFGTGAGTILLDVSLGGDDGETPAALFLSAGRPVVVGSADADASRTAGFVYRLTNAYVFADGFEAGTVAAWTGSAP